jgi:lysozyme family protein
MQSVNEIAREIVAREGGYVNDPDDPGGATNFGVTIHTMRRLGLDLDNDGKITPKDVRKLTAKKAEQIFVNHYFVKPKINELPVILQASVFDMYVNAGGNAVKILQRLLVEFGLDVEIDGALGPHSIRAAHLAFEMAPRFLGDAYGIERRNYYYKLADRRKASRKYARRRDGGKGGWIKRAEEFIAQKYHFTKTEHVQRVKSWD